MPLRLPEPPASIAPKMTALAKGLVGDFEYVDALLKRFPLGQHFPPRPVTQLFDLLIQEPQVDFGLLEWCMVLDAKGDWDNSDPKHAFNTANVIWNSALLSDIAWRLITRRMALMAMKVEKWVPSLIETMPLERYNIPSNKKASLELLSALFNESFEAVVEQCWKKRCTVREYFDAFNLPILPKLQQTIDLQCLETFANRASKNSVMTEWALKLLNQNSRTYRLNAAEVLLRHMDPLSVEKHHPALIKWMTRQFVGQEATLSREELSIEGQKKVGPWIGAANYLDFEHLSEIMLRPEYESPLQMNKANNAYKLRTRTHFWSNYRSQFRQVRILVPQKTFDVLKDANTDFSFSSIELFEPDDTKSKYQAEVGIFELDQVILVQEFRTSSSGLIVLENNSYNREILFENKPSLMQIRALDYKFVHDHDRNEPRYYWQDSCAAKLRALGVFPDGRLKRLGTEAYSINKNWIERRDELEERARIWVRQNRRFGSQSHSSFQSASRRLNQASTIEMAPVPAGRFLMGALPKDKQALLNEKPQHTVDLRFNYFVGKTLVTQAQWLKVMGYNPSHFKGANLPVEQVSWFDCVRFCNKLSAMEGKKTVYSIFGNVHSGINVSANWEANGYRLLTEAEWEYSARGGEYFLYSGSDKIDEVAWYAKNSVCTKPVGLLKPNGFGLFDMTGNVGEWCWDSVDGEYSKYLLRIGQNHPTNPTGPDNGQSRIFKGGGWSRQPYNLRVSRRFNFKPSSKSNKIGFRLIRRDETYL